MTQQPRITTRNLDEFEEFQDAVSAYMQEVHAAMEDGVIDDGERQRIGRCRRIAEREGIEAAYFAGYVDATFEAGIAMLRGGPDSERAQRLTRDVVNIERHRNEKRRRGNGPHDSAA